VVFYIIDGGGADLMSLYGYARKTTPALEALAKDGVVFDHAFSNATWTQASTASFMTSLQHSVLGGLRRGVALRRRSPKRPRRWRST
jgi:arylsulfatase A-like enzyme